MTDPDASNSAKALYAYLQGLTESDQVLFGHQNDVSRSVGTKDELGDVQRRSPVLSAVFLESIPLHCLEARQVEQMQNLHWKIPSITKAKANRNGAIVTLSAHMPKLHKREDQRQWGWNLRFL